MDKDFAAWIEGQLDALYRFAHTFDMNFIEPGDLVQETVYRVLRHIKKHGMISCTRAFLFTVMKNHYISEYRRNRTVNFDDSILEKIVGSQNQVNLDFAENLSPFSDKVQRAINGLDERYRIPLYLFAVEDYTNKEIAEILDIPVGTVLSLIHRAKKKFKEHLATEKVIYETR